MLGIAGSVFYTKALPINADNRKFVHDATCCNKPPLPQRSKWEPATEWNSLPPVPACGHAGCMARWRALVCSTSLSLAVLDVLALRGGHKVFHIPLGQEARVCAVVTADLLLSACPLGGTPSIHTVAKEVFHPGALRSVMTLSKHAAIRNSFYQAFLNVADFCNVSMPSKAEFFMEMQRVNTYFDPLLVVGRRMDSLGHFKVLIEGVAHSVLLRVRCCLGLGPGDAVDVRPLPYQWIFQWALLEEYKERFPDERTVPADARALAAAEEIAPIKINGVSTHKRGPSADVENVAPLKRFDTSGTDDRVAEHVLLPSPAQWRRGDIEDLGNRAYCYAQTVLSSPTKHPAAVADLLGDDPLPGRSSRYSIARRFEREAEGVLERLRDDQGGYEKLIATELEKPPQEQRPRQLQQWRNQLRELHNHWLPHLWGPFVERKPLAELSLRLWTAKCKMDLQAPVPAAVPTVVFHGWVFQHKGQGPKPPPEPLFWFLPRAPNCWGFVTLPAPAIGSLLIKGMNQFKVDVVQRLQQNGAYSKAAADALAREFLRVKLRLCGKQSKLKRGSMANISKYIDGDWGASTVHGEAASTVVGIVNALVAFDAFFTSKYANQMGANPTIQCDGHNVHFVVKQGVGRVKHRKERDRDDAIDSGEELQPLPPDIRAIGVDVNQDGLSFGVATARFQRDVEAELLGDDVAEWPPDRNDDKGLQ